MDDNSSQPNVDASDDALMAQMGFSSFGAASPPSKRRRYNPRADASLPPKPPKPSATGANSTALGTGSNTDEIALDDDDEPAQQPAQQPAQVRPASLPQRPAPAAGSRPGHHQSKPPGTKDTWYVGYYDPMSNENPWERLEKARGLEPQGTWLPRGAPSTATTGAPS